MTLNADESSGIVVFGASAGGLPVITTLWKQIANVCQWPLALVQHYSTGGDEFLAKHLSVYGDVVVAHSRMALAAGRLHLAPVNYHLLVEDCHTLSLSVDAPENHCRPAIDPLFVSAARVFGTRTLAVVLTGANQDGVKGAACVEQAGGQVLVQSPECAEVDVMPKAALNRCQHALSLSLDQIATEINKRTGR